MSQIDLGLHWDLTKRIIAAFYQVRRELGQGFPEHVYSNALATALRETNLRVTREAPYEVVFHGVVVGVFRADLVVEDKVLVECKIYRIGPRDREQAWHYLAASKLKVAVITNFGDNPATARVEVP
jgi:GxxExxY protein